MGNKHDGSTLESFLREEGIYEELEADVLKSLKEKKDAEDGHIHSGDEA